MQPDVFLVAIDQDVVVGSAVSSIIAGYDGHRGWLYAVAVLKSHQRQGIATALVREAEKLLVAMGCKQINLQVRSSDAEVIRFYRSLGYEVEERVSMKKIVPKQSDIHPAQACPPAEEPSIIRLK
jgi:ribosomal protein S18 acetylase RimI-like enzyme